MTWRRTTRTSSCRPSTRRSPNTRKVRLVYVLGPEFGKYEGNAVWEDLKLGARHPASFERIAVVTDARWAGPAIKVFSVLWPGQARAFPLSELEPAKRWAAADAGRTLGLRRHAHRGGVAPAPSAIGSAPGPRRRACGTRRSGASRPSGG